ncbi:MAG TPA: hypothetical protein VFV67_16140 [Actinophytocola sp.]|uniref:hypothetical protein n=1 Tax=Actinophytocola sp. TaxID=1872138 RepID=UPI002DB9BE73|nr:hypothetical protein [Actinophytocola sp.]HEU5472184.1 hypothetical protein [Actinophytocola sp.]
MPDGTTGTNQPPSSDPTASDPPPAPGDQIQTEIALSRVIDTLGGLFGSNWTAPTAGGGGTGGQFMFASIEQLDSVIAQWRAEVQAISADGNEIQQAVADIGEPADDGMSTGHADAARKSLTTLLEHNFAMQDYATQYLDKLLASRQSMVNSDLTGRDRMTSEDRG